MSTDDPAEPLNTTGRTLRFRGNPVEKHCSRLYNVRRVLFQRHLPSA